MLCSERKITTSQVDLPRVAYYLGALIATSAMVGLVPRAWEPLGGAGIFLISTAYAVFGAAGVFFYLRHLAYGVFNDSLMLPLALTALGLGIIYTGLQYQHHHAIIEARLRPHRPSRSASAMTTGKTPGRVLSLWGSLITQRASSTRSAPSTSSASVGPMRCSIGGRIHQSPHGHKKRSSGH